MKKDKLRESPQIASPELIDETRRVALGVLQSFVGANRRLKLRGWDYDIATDQDKVAFRTKAFRSYILSMEVQRDDERVDCIVVNEDDTEDQLIETWAMLNPQAPSKLCSTKYMYMPQTASVVYDGPLFDTDCRDLKSILTGIQRRTR